MRTKNNMFGIYDSISTSDRERYSSVMEYCDSQLLSAYCSECHNKLGDIEEKIIYSASIKSTNIPTEVLDDIMPQVQGLYQFKAKCKKCGKETMHYVVDYNMGPVLQMLNRLGIRTLFSCESHGFYMSEGVSMPYIAFPTDVKEYFDMDNKLLQYFELDYPADSGYTDWEFVVCLRVSDSAPVIYITSKEYLKDLKKYIKNFLIPKMNKETSNMKKFIGAYMDLSKTNKGE